MVIRDPLAVPSPTGRRQLAFRLAIPFTGLALYGFFAELWYAGALSAYFGVLRLLGVEPFDLPFIDIGVILSAAECRRQGFDIYLTNPCDALSRPHGYSPVWITLIPDGFGKWATGWVGVSLDLMFILSWAILLRPRTVLAMLLFGLAALSPTTVYALERANNDIVLFLLILCGAILSAAEWPYRLGAYALYLVAGLLKYYPLALLMLLARERRRDAVVGAIAAGLVLVLSGVYYRAELGKALMNIPVASYFTDSFSARNLPFGMAEALGGGVEVGRSLIAFALLTVLVAVAIARAARTICLLEPERFDFSDTEMQCLVIGAMLVTVCFFAGQNIDYRGIYLLLVLPGLVRLHKQTPKAAIRRFYWQMIVAVLFVMWEEFLRRILHNLVAPGISQGLGSRAETFFWVGRELVWWWLAVGLAAIVWSFFGELPLVRGAVIRAGGLPPTLGRQEPR